MAGINRTTGKATDLITFSRASGGTALRKISYGSELGSEILSDWTAVNGGTVSQDGDWLLITSNQSLGSGISLEFPSTQGSVYQWSMEVDLLTATTVDVQLAVSSTGGGDAFSPSSYVYINSDRTVTYTGVCTDGTSPSYITVFPRGVGLTARIRNISVKEVLFDQPDGTLTLFNHPAGIPRIDYDADGSVKGLLIEEQRTNLVTYSDLSANAVAINGSLVQNYAVSPDGGTNAVRLIDSSAGGSNAVYVQIPSAEFTVANSAAYTFSVYLKADQLNWARIVAQNFTTPATGAVWFDLQNGVVGTQNTGLSGKIEAVGSGWYRCSVTFTTDAADTTGRILLGAVASDGTFSVPLDGTSSILIYGAQLEAGSFPTSYIPTSGATATRAADVASISVDSFGYNQSEGTVVVEFEVTADHGTSVALAGLGSDSFLASNASKIYMSSSSSRHLRVFSDAGVALFEIDAGTTPIGQVVKQAFSIKSGDHAAVIDGGTVATSSDANTLPNPTRLFIDPPSGHIKSLAYYPRRLTNDQLVELTS